MKTLKPHQVTTYLKNQKNSEIIFTENLTKDKSKINLVPRSADKIIIIHEQTKI